MPNTSQNLLSYLRVVVGAWRDDPRDDAELLAQFAEVGDESAFKALVCRHGLLVWRTCRGILGDTPDAEDAFQTTFLALARKAGRIRREPLAGWLHQVARQAAMDVHAGARRRQGLEQRLRAVKQTEAQEGARSRAELYAALDEELAGLPERLRMPLLLHYLEGKSQVEVARLLGCARSVVQYHLTRAEAALRKRLERRGLAVDVGSLAALLTSSVVISAAPARLIGSTARAAVAFRSESLTGGAAEAARAVLGALPTSLETTIVRKSLWIVLACCLGLGSATLVTYRSLSARPDEPGEAGPAAAQAPGQPGLSGRAAARVDCFGDPLPAGSLARMGTVRQWYGRLEFTSQATLAFSPDDKMLASSSRLDRRSVCLWDAATGKEIRRLATGWVVGFSPDDNALVTVDMDQTVWWEVATGKLLHQLKRSQEPKREARFVGITFLPSGKILTLDEARKGDNSDNRIYLWDVATEGREISQLKGRGKGGIGSRTLAFSRDGKMVAATEGANPEIIQLWEVATGKKIHQLQLTREEGEEDARNIRVCSVTFSPDGKKLAAGRDSFGAICEWDVATGKPIHRFKASGQGAASPLIYSPDGKTLLGGWEGHLWDVATGKEIRSFDWKDARVAVFSHNGKILAVGDQPGVIRLWEVATGKEILPHKGHHDRVHSVAYSPDGKTLASVSSDQTVRLWEVTTGKEIRQLAKHATWGSGSLGYSPDGKMLASMDNVIHLWDTATGKEIRQFDGGSRPESVVFSPDGKKLAAIVNPTIALNFYQVYLWEVATGRLIYQWPANDPNGHGGPVSLAFSPDGRLLAAPGKEKNTVRMWEVATGKPISQLQLKPQGKRVWSLAFSPAGRVLATSSINDEKIRVWEVTSGKEIWQLDSWQVNGRKWCPQGYTLALSPDGMVLATAAQGANFVDGSMDPKVHLWEMATGKKIGQLAGHRAIVRTVAFSPDGKTLASGSDDLTCLVWDLTSVGRLKPVPASPLSKEQLEAAWTDLANDPAKAYGAIRVLQAAPTQAIALLQARVRPVAPLANQQQLQRWVADLDANNFTVREKAQREIEKLGEVAVPALRQALKGQPALELKRRLHALLVELEPKVVVVSPQRLRELRAVQVLESVGTVEARQVLQAWAKGVPGARLTVEAEAALARLAKRSPAKP